MKLFSPSMTFDPISGAPKVSTCRKANSALFAFASGRHFNKQSDSSSSSSSSSSISYTYTSYSPSSSVTDSFIHSIATSADSIHSGFSAEKSMSSTSSHVTAYRALKILLFAKRSPGEWQYFAIDKKMYEKDGGDYGEGGKRISPMEDGKSPTLRSIVCPLNSRDYSRTYRPPSID